MRSPANEEGRTRAVLYDGACGLCSGVVGTLRRLDVLARVEFLDVTGEWAEISARYPQLSQDACLIDIHVADRTGRVQTGFEAYRSLACVLPIAWPVLPLLFVPGVTAIGRRVYRYVADHRTRDTCALPPRTITRTDGAAIPTGRPPRT